MTMVVLGAAGGLGRNVVEAAARAGQEVRALVRQVRGDPFPATVQVIEGDARRPEDIRRAFQGVEVAYFCLNPRFARWLEDFPPLLASAVAGARAAGVRLVFPANVWIYGPGRPGQRIDETRLPAPTSQRGRLRAAMEQALRDSGCRFAMVRLPEYYGPQVVTLTARVFQAALRGTRMLWPGPLSAEVEFVFMADAAEALLQVGSGEGIDGEVFHVPGIPTTAREFIGAIYQAVGRQPRALPVPPFLLKLAGLGSPTVRAAADIAHLLDQSHPSGWLQIRAPFWSSPSDPVPGGDRTNSSVAPQCSEPGPPGIGEGPF
jgi:nucleoside-diphosphate-sugar epimerase